MPDYALLLLLPVAATRKKKKKGNLAPAFEKPVRELDFILLFLFKNKIGALKPSPPAGNSKSALLLPSSPLAALDCG
ncbi:hypothetical protein SLEP1_g56110 [Rubroshorea leprosula]|uniref:Uncharacterized protein n=1 Tax=Rubroshorea leprosula TaxID=152421 RepID=A0AAV5MHU5_9ROSI|nr:hypothetical protein SLEP1_g56110 [Rubroshorea leprosula]